jgi:hypothetical protein
VALEQRVHGGRQDVGFYQQRLANGEDPRPWEPFGTSRWGETFDLITNQAPVAAMRHYPVIILATGGPMDDTPVGAFTQYVQGGGTLVVNATVPAYDVRVYVLDPR